MADRGRFVPGSVVNGFWQRHALERSSN